MAFLSKEELEKESKRLGIDLTGLTYQQQQGVMIAALKADGTSKPPVNKGVRGKAKIIRKDEPNIDMYKGKTIIVSPELAMTRIQPFGFEEELGEEVAIDEYVYDKMLQRLSSGGFNTTDDKPQITHGVVSLGGIGKKTVATTGLPKWNAELTFDIDHDWVFKAKFQHSEGYLWTHSNLPNVKGLLEQCGELYNWIEEFDRRKFYVGTSLLCVPIDYTNFVFSKIMKDKHQK